MSALSISSIVLATSTALFGAASASAAGASAQVIDRPLINTATLDLGGSFAGGNPTSGAWLDWRVVGGSVRPVLTGNLRGPAGLCGKVRMVYYNPAHVLLAARQTPVYCGASTNVVRIDAYSNPAARHVHINLDRRNADGTFTTLGTSIQSM